MVTTNKRGRPASTVKATPIVESPVAETKDEIIETAPVSVSEPTQEPIKVEIKSTTANIPSRPIQRFDKYDVVDVINNYHGKLVYVSSVTGYAYEWEEIGEIQQFPVEELINMRNSQVGFYRNNWIEFDKEISEELKRFLHVEKHYENSIRADEFEELLKEPTDVIAERVSKMPNNAKDNFARFAAQMIEERKLDSLKIIDAIEESLGYKITESE
jgi:hypothetical protein